MGKFSFVIGAGVGYLLGARAGRQQFEKIKRASKNVWQDPRVQQGVQKVEGKVSEVAREQGSAVTDKVAGMVKGKLGSDGRHSSPSTSTPSSSTTSQGIPDGPAPAPTPPQPDIDAR
ncbi:YtxH domain-containing protein [Georgenia faecalis]|uniref:YtxH domain-containing protein n=1 Tax=Georgenia faecalis TaxID=2483799 RepID=A0ABV9D9M9_9MICO|nr:YtxH domain-containing protein [Georgenia faecalis]